MFIVSLELVSLLGVDEKFKEILSYMRESCFLRPISRISGVVSESYFCALELKLLLHLW